MSPSHKHVRGECLAVREVLNRVGDKWSVLIVALLGDQPKRFSELRRMIEGISQRMLTLTLKGLERDGLIIRTVYPSMPRRVEYQLTNLGRSLPVPIRDSRIGLGRTGRRFRMPESMMHGTRRILRWQQLEQRLIEVERCPWSFGTQREMIDSH
jgi:DNA-binding HxlR family transcriptional regulator